MEAAKKGEGSQLRPYCPDAFNIYISWFLQVTRIEICNRAFRAEILEEPIDYDELAQTKFNKLVREGRTTGFACFLNFVVMYLVIWHFQTHCWYPYMCAVYSSQRAGIKKQADECEDMYVQSLQDKKASSVLLDFVKVCLRERLSVYLFGTVLTLCSI